MDTSEEYIKMCELAKEIQELFKPTDGVSGDFVCRKRDRKLVVLYYNKYDGYPPEEYTNRDTAIWLPRQDQLQEIVFDKTLLSKPANMLQYCLDFINQNYQRFFSMESLWLAFVMKEKYGKTWDGKEWKKQ